MSSPENQTQNKDVERDRLDLQRIKLENERLQKEIKGIELQNQEKLKPFYRWKPFLIAALPCLIALVGGLVKFVDAKHVYAQAELKRERAEFDSRLLKEENDELTEKKAKLTKETKNLEKQRNDIEVLIANLTQERDNLQKQTDYAHLTLRRLKDKIDSSEGISSENRKDLVKEINKGQEGIRDPGASRHLAIGKPQALYERVREGYVVGHDSRLKIPVWVQYELNRSDLKGSAARRDDFRADGTIPYRYRAETDDYEDSGYDRGHMAPAGDMKRSEKVMSESFLLSNVAPQVGYGFNRDIWRSLETAVRVWVQDRERLTIITGPIFAVQNNKVSYDVIGENNVAVPSHFYKIIVDNNDPNNIQALAFMMPNQDLTGGRYKDYLTTIDQIESASGIDFLSALPAAVQNTVESSLPMDVWQ